MSHVSVHVGEAAAVTSVDSVIDVFNRHCLELQQLGRDSDAASVHQQYQLAHKTAEAWDCGHSHYKDGLAQKLADVLRCPPDVIYALRLVARTWPHVDDFKQLMDELRSRDWMPSWSLIVAAARCRDPEEAGQLLADAGEKGLSVRDVRERVKEQLASKKPNAAPRAKPLKKSLVMLKARASALLDQLADIADLPTRVKATKPTDEEATLLREIVTMLTQCSEVSLQRAAEIDAAIASLGCAAAGARNWTLILNGRSALHSASSQRHDGDSPAVVPPADAAALVA